MPKNKLRVEPNERIDIQDFEFLSQSGIHDNTEQLLEQLMCSTTRTKKWVLSGFVMSNPGTKQLQVTKGKAILAERREGAVRYGMLVTEGDASKIIDLNTYSEGDYGIYIRFEAVPGQNESRIFWNPAGTGTEYASSINTRYLANWSLRVEAASPGAEWLRIGTVAQATMAITDEREFYFEGSLPDSYESGWSTDGGGVANDRNADRATYGITDFQAFTAATRQCLEDVKGRGLRAWYERDIGGMNIGFDANPVEGQLAVGDAYFNFELNTSNPRFNLDDSDYLEYNRTANTLKFTLLGTDAFLFSVSTFEPLYSWTLLGAADKRWGKGYFYSLDVITNAGGGTGIYAEGGAGSGVSPGGAGVEGVGGVSDLGGGGLGGSFIGGAASVDGSGGGGLYVLGGAAALGQNSGQGIQVSTQGTAFNTGTPGRAAYIAAGSISSDLNPSNGAIGVSVFGGNVAEGGGYGGDAIVSLGGSSEADYGGNGLYSTGGAAEGSGKYGGYGVKAVGGGGTNSAVGGPGVYGQGGIGTSYDGAGGQFDRKTNGANLHISPNVAEALTTSSSGDVWVEGTLGSMALKVNLNGNITTLALGA